MKSFFDTSALAKRYIHETGTESVNILFARSENVLVSIICLPEIFSALNRLRRQKAVAKSHYAQIKRTILKEFEGFSICAVTPHVISRSLQLLERYELRAMDAIHLACAQEMKAQIFVSADIRQTSIARKMKFEIVQV